MSVEDHDRMFDLVESNTRESSELRARVYALGERIENLERTIETRIHMLEEEMGTMNAHLDNIARETAITNDLARKRLAREEAENVRESEIRKDKVEIVKRSAMAVWGVLKFPLSTLLAGVVAWFLYWYFYVPDYGLPGSKLEIVNPKDLEDGK